MTHRVSQGFAPQDRRRVAFLFWQAFQTKLSPMLGNDAQALRFIAENIQSEATFCAWSGDTLVGGVGVRTSTQGFLGGGYRDLARVYGPVSALWRGALLGLFDQKVTDEQVLIDGIFTDPAWRSQGVGSALLEHVANWARSLGKTHVVLDVVVENPRAVGLYERHGFTVENTKSMGPLRHIFGFSAVHRMQKRV